MGMILFFLILLFLWQGTYWIGVDVLEIFKSYSVPSPLGVGRCFLELMQDGSLLQATLNSLFRGILGYAIAVLIGVALGVSLSFQIFAKKHEAHYSWYTDTAQCVLGTVFNPLVWPFDTSYPFCCCDGIGVWYCNFS